MPSAPRPWTVLPHGAIEKLEENLWAVAGTLPRVAINRRMSIVRLAGGGLLFHNAIPLREDAMREVERFGDPAVLVVPNRVHRLDVHAFKARYRDLRVVCPAEARPHVERIVPVDGDWSALPRDGTVEAAPLAGSRWGEAALVVRSAGGGRASLLFADTVMNIPHQRGLEGVVLRLIGSTGGPRVTPLTRVLAIRDAGAIGAALRRLARTPGLVRLVPTHGEIVSAQAAAVLERVAAALR